MANLKKLVSKGSCVTIYTGFLLR